MLAIDIMQYDMPDNDAVQRHGTTFLNEFEAKQVLESYAIPVTHEDVAGSCDEARRIANRIGYPVALKGCSSTMTHKTEHDLVRLNVTDDRLLKEAYHEITAKGVGRLDGVLVQEMIRGQREFMAGLVRDPQFGPCVMFGLGGIFTEVFRDVTFRVAPVSREDALAMMGELRSSSMLGSFRGKPPVNREALAEVLVNLGRIGLECDEISEIDINPLIARNNGCLYALPVAVDALVVLKTG